MKLDEESVYRLKEELLHFQRDNKESLMDSLTIQGYANALLDRLLAWEEEALVLSKDSPVQQALLSMESTDISEVLSEVGDIPLLQKASNINSDVVSLGFKAKRGAIKSKYTRRRMCQTNQ